jgi:hypothetical protein
MKKEELLHAVHTAWAALDAVLARVPRERLCEAGPATGMAVKDLLAHIAWYEREIVGVIRRHELTGSDLWNLPLDPRNAAIFELNRERPLEEIEAEFRYVHMQFVAAVETLTQEDLDLAARYPYMPQDWVPGELFAQSSNEHYQQHTTDLEKWLHEINA